MIVAGGGFRRVGGPANYIRLGAARFLPDGSVEGDFSPNVTQLSGSGEATVHTVNVQADGRIIIGGNFTRLGTLENIFRVRLARFAPSGALEA